MTHPARPLSFDPSALDVDAAALLPRLESADAAVRRIALIELADLEDERLIEPIVAALSGDAAQAVRAEAARLLGAWERDDVVEGLCTALVDPSHEVREAAAHSLAEVRRAQSGAILVRFGSHADAFVRGAVLHALRELRYAGAFDPALLALGDDDAAVRLEAVGVLGWLKDERALSALTALTTTEPNAQVRRAAIGALGFAARTDADATQVVVALLTALRDAAWQVREEAAATLGKLRAQAARDALIAALDDEYWQVRLQAARALGKLRDALACEALVSLLTHAISNLRKEAALALGEIGASRALPALRAAESDADPEVRKAVRIALAQIDALDR
ncbi:HEAT repeat domain-containing protein [Trinickia terrae]|uniref:HEAT repeat domain-containing protein n=1 Tax=Trinickia terrae TaxID=2571161 RepID=A0A4U1IFB2_9BURK|nr:HEAT repeat domain-containing protein [Trinickia terrae]TKC92357.1 HEAT repeat domain-containing protein [Trinickia terrae]